MWAFPRLPGAGGSVWGCAGWRTPSSENRAVTPLAGVPRGSSGVREEHGPLPTRTGEGKRVFMSADLAITLVAARMAG